MTRPIKYRQLRHGRWHYWGFIDGAFVGPADLSPSYQYTGFTDKRRNEIYEGDILTGGRVVKWDKDGQWVIEDRDDLTDPLWRWAKVVEVVGDMLKAAA